jgi:hypothetical protein
MNVSHRLSLLNSQIKRHISPVLNMASLELGHAQAPLMHSAVAL